MKLKNKQNIQPGISQWEKNGKKFGYWNYFKEEIEQKKIKDIKNEIINAINKYKNTTTKNNSKTGEILDKLIISVLEKILILKSLQIKK